MESNISTEPSVRTSMVFAGLAPEVLVYGRPSSTGSVTLGPDDPPAGTKVNSEVDVDLVNLNCCLMLLKPTAHSCGLVFASDRRRDHSGSCEASQSSANASFFAMPSPLRNLFSCSTIFLGSLSPMPKKTKSAHFHRKGLMATTNTNQ